MGASDLSKYEEVLLESSNGSDSVDLRLGVQSIDYFEDIFSPTITAKIVVTTTGDAVNGKSIVQGLPCRGGERLSLRIAGNAAGMPGLDFSDKEKYFYVSGVSNVISTNQRESFVLNLYSREAITNETARVPKKFPTSAPISVSAEDIIKTYLQTSKKIDVDKSMNKYGFIGNMRKPFTVLTWLASKAVPETKGNGTAGYCFFETKSGFKFRSLDSLIGSNSKATYIANDVVNEDGLKQDYTIVEYAINRNQNVLENLRLGVYSSFRSYFNPVNFAFTHPEKGVFKMDDYINNTKNLGEKFEFPPISEESELTLGDVPTRLLTGVLDLGTQEVGVSTARNADALLYQSQALFRYNTLFTQQVTATLPCNTNLEAGDVIECLFPETTTKKKKEYDQMQSGLYMIKELRHHFDPNGSYTAVKLVRDTYGQSNPNNEEK